MKEKIEELYESFDGDLEFPTIENIDEIKIKFDELGRTFVQHFNIFRRFAKDSEDIFIGRRLR